MLEVLSLLLGGAIELIRRNTIAIGVAIGAPDCFIVGNLRLTKVKEFFRIGLILCEYSLILMLGVTSQLSIHPYWLKLGVFE